MSEEDLFHIACQDSESMKYHQSVAEGSITYLFM